MISLILCAAALAGTKGTTAYTVRSEAIAGGARELIIDLSDVLPTPDPEVGSRRPMSLDKPVMTLRLARERAPRPAQRMWSGSQAGQYRGRLLATGELQGVVRIDATRSDGKAFEVLLPLSNGVATEQIAKPTTEPLAGVAALGRARFEGQCASCHAAAKFETPETMWRLSDAALLDAIWLPALDAADVFAFLQPMRPALARVGASGKRYTLRTHVPTDEERKNARRVAGLALAVKRVLLVPLFEGVQAYVDADAINPKKDQRAGYGAIVTLARDEQVWLQLDVTLKVVLGPAALLAQGNRDLAQAPRSDTYFAAHGAAVAFEAYLAERNWE